MRELNRKRFAETGEYMTKVLSTYMPFTFIRQKDIMA